MFFNNVNTVRSEMWLLSFPHHSCQKRPSKSLVFDSWFERLLQHLWCGKHNTHISSSQYSLNAIFFGTITPFDFLCIFYLNYGKFWGPIFLCAVPHLLNVITSILIKLGSESPIRTYYVLFKVLTLAVFNPVSQSINTRVLFSWNSN